MWSWSGSGVVNKVEGAMVMVGEGEGVEGVMDGVNDGVVGIMLGSGMR